MSRTAVHIDKIDVSAYRIPTDAPEADGTYGWDHTVMVLVEVSGGGKTGLAQYCLNSGAGNEFRDRN